MNRVNWAGGAILAALAGVVGASAGGCTAIVGVGDYAVGATDASDDGSSGVGSSGASSGVSSSGTSGGSGSSSGITDAHSFGDGAGTHFGDPCTTTSDCAHGVCNGLWCTQSCTTNVACGDTSLGTRNDCVATGTGSVRLCAPECTTNGDCLPYPGSTCVATGGLSVCTAPATTTEGGTSSGGGPGVIGDPCSTNADCGVGTCLGRWCSQACTSATDTSCGSNSAFQTNYCVQNVQNNFFCFPGCQTSADCTSYSLTTCQTNTSTSNVCSVTDKKVGDPCNVNTDCTAPATCNGNSCTQACTAETAAADTTCGSTSTGQQNYCVYTGTSGEPYSCFTGCSQFGDCAPYTGLFCEQIYGSTRGFVCANSGGAVGDPCAKDSDCTSPATCAGSWCTQPCTSYSDTSCGTNSESITNYCTQMQDSSGTISYECFPGCSVDKDCTSFGALGSGGVTCQMFSGMLGTVCSF